MLAAQVKNKWSRSLYAKAVDWYTELGQTSGNSSIENAYGGFCERDQIEISQKWKISNLSEILYHISNY